jgi:hypothetical protein
VALVAVCANTVTAIVPVVAPTGTVVDIDVAVLVSTVANVPLKLTVLLAGVILKLVPVIVTGVPAIPLNGLKLVIVGWAKVTDEKSVTKASRVKGILSKCNVCSLEIIPCLIAVYFMFTEYSINTSSSPDHGTKARASQCQP